MKRIWNALCYGDGETKKCIRRVMLFAVLAVLLIAASGISGYFYLFILGMLAGTVAIMVSQTFTLVDDDYVTEVNQKGEKETVESVSVKKTEVTSVEKQTEKPNGSNENQDSNEASQFDHYNDQVLKKIKKKYHIKKDHRPIIIDYSRSYRIKECPAFIWRIHNKVLLLLLEKEPRRISISRDLIRNIGYAPNVTVDSSKEYRAFEKRNLVTQVFKGYLPDYCDSKIKKNNLKSKNLYIIYPDIYLSNRSAAVVMDMLCLNFMPEDKITKSEKINGFFKRIYAANILYKDKVYSITEYKDAVEKTLNEMCYAEMPKREFLVTLENMVRGRLLSQEYADHYIDLKEKIVEKRN